MISHYSIGNIPVMYIVREHILFRLVDYIVSYKGTCKYSYQINRYHHIT